MLANLKNLRKWSKLMNPLVFAFIILKNKGSPGKKTNAAAWVLIAEGTDLTFLDFSMKIRLLKFLRKVSSETGLINQYYCEAVSISAYVGTSELVITLWSLAGNVSTVAVNLAKFMVFSCGLVALGSLFARYILNPKML